MTASTSRNADSASPAAALADELRALNLMLQSTVIDDTQLAKAAAQIGELRSKLTGEKRLRWYEDETSGGYHDSDYAEHTLFQGSKNAMAAPLDLAPDQRSDGRAGMVGHVVLNRLYEGPPGSAHGGYLAGLFDSLFGGTMRLVEGNAVTGLLEIKYRNRTPLDQPLEFHSWVENDSGRRLQLAATCHSGQTLTAEASALFVRVESSTKRAK